MIGSLLFGAALVAISLGLLAGHWNAWRAVDHGGLPERERLFFQRQFRRRTHTSGAIGLVGLLIISGLWLEDEHAYALEISGDLPAFAPRSLNRHCMAYCHTQSPFFSSCRILPGTPPSSV